MALTPFPARFTDSGSTVATVLSSSDLYGAMHAALNLLEDGGDDSGSVTLFDPAEPGRAVARIAVGHTDVFVVTPDEADPAAFERREDAAAFSETYAEVPAGLFTPEVYRVTIADAGTAAEMIRNRQED